MMKYHITIMDNETGEVYLDDDSAAIVGAVTNKDRVSAISYTRCGRATFSEVVGAAWAIALRMYRENKDCRRAIEVAKRKIECDMSMEAENESPAS